MMMGFAVLGVVAGCSGDHMRGSNVDAGPPVGDVGPSCDPGQAPPFSCLFVDGNHVCGDVGQLPICSGGAWACPAGTSPDSQCWCSGFARHDPSCACTPGGWVCEGPDAGVSDAGFVCPADTTTLDGQPCSADGAFCGTCTNPCGGGICDRVDCEGGRWQRQFFGCPATIFRCGPTLYCNFQSQYCERFQSDVAGEADTWRCTDFPEDCPTSCACFAGTPGSGSCTEEGNDVTVTYAGG